MFKYVVVILALVMVKVGNGKTRLSPLILDRIALELDIKKNPQGQYQLSGTGKIVMEQILTNEGERSDGTTMQTTLTCSTPVRIDIPIELPGMNEALTAELKQIIGDIGLAESVETQHFTTGFFGFSKGEAHALVGGSYKGLFGRYTFRLAKQLEGVDTKGVTGVVNDSGLGFMLPIGSDFNRHTIVDIQALPDPTAKENGMCESIRKNGFVIKK